VSPLLVAFLLAQTLVLAVWVARQLKLNEAVTKGPRLPITPPGEIKNPPLVSVVIPARNEEHNIGQCLESLLQQSYPNLEILVADDRSEDGTAEVVRGYAEKHPHVRLVQVTELPPGWTGKTHALARAAQEAAGEWLLFVDADTRLHKHNVANAVLYAREHDVGMLSLLPRNVGHTFWENVLQPVLGGMLVIRFPLAAVNDPDRRLAFANGQYILIRRDCYEAVGGHEEVRGELLEDIALAKEAKAKRCRLTLLYGFQAATVRMYGSFGDIWRGWRRIFIHAFERSIPSLIVSALLVLVFSLNPLVLASAAGVVLALGAGQWLAWTSLALGLTQTVVMMAVLVGMYRRLVLADARYLVFYPVAMLIGLGILIDAIFTLAVRRPVNWRGTVYHPSLLGK